MPQHSEDAARPAPRSARQPSHIVRDEDTATVRVRKTSARDGVGRELYGRPDQRDLSAAHLLPAVSPMSSLLPAKHGPFQGQVTRCARKRLQAGLAVDTNHAHQLTLSRGAVKKPLRGRCTS